jgi:hypothetical protein
MPHFDEYGGDLWICQICTKTFNSRVESTWLDPIPGRAFSGNACPSCISKPQTEAKATPEGKSQPTAKSRANRRQSKPLGRAGREPLNRLDFDNPAEYELRRELERLGIENAQQPASCLHCGASLNKGEGMAGETILFCAEHGIIWEDAEGAIRNVF